MPKIAMDIATHRTQTPVEFYWHLGDFRALYRPDCDHAKLNDPTFDCSPDKNIPNNDPKWKNTLSEYLPSAWNDFVQKQLKPFEPTPVILAIGNHELINHSHDEVQARFKSYLTSPAIQAQAQADRKNGIEPTAGNTYFHFRAQGADVICLDNSKNSSFGPQQLAWLARVLDGDRNDDEVTTIIVGMHAALPQSSSSNHAMDASCEGVCSGSLAYDLLYKAQNLEGAQAKRKKVYVLSSHSHYFRQDIYKTEAHRGRVLPGWIVGTAGAEQYKAKEEPIAYGYVLIEVRPEGNIVVTWKPVQADSPPQLTGKGAAELVAFCFEKNKREPPDRPNPKTCDCGN